MTLPLRSCGERSPGWIVLAVVLTMVVYSIASVVRMHRSAGGRPEVGDLATAEAEAHATLDAGIALYRQAMDMPPSEERKARYQQADEDIRKASDLYANLCKKYPGNEDLEAKLVEAGKLRFGGPHRCDW